jgi:hypothetical protein
MAANIPGSILNTTRTPLDDKYWVQNFQELEGGLTYQGLMRFSRSEDKLYIKLTNGWVPIATGNGSGGTGTGGTAATIRIGTVTTGTPARITNVGTDTNAVLNFVLPKGDTGAAATIQIERVETSPDGIARITNLGTPQNASYVIQLPRGQKGDTGAAFRVNAQGTYADRSLYNGQPDGYVYQVNEAGRSDDGYIYIRVGASGWSDRIAFRGPKGDKGLGVYIAFADTYDGVGRTYILDSNKKFISYLNALERPQLSEFQVWVGFTQSTPTTSSGGIEVVSSYTSLPAQGADETIYITRDTKYQYFWDVDHYEALTSGSTTGNGGSFNVAFPSIPEYTATSGGQQVIQLPADAKGVIDLNYLQSGEGVLPFYRTHYSFSLSNTTLTILPIAGVRAGDKITGSYYTLSTSTGGTGTGGTTLPQNVVDALLAAPLPSVTNHYVVKNQLNDYITKAQPLVPIYAKSLSGTVYQGDDIQQATAFAGIFGNIILHSRSGVTSGSITIQRGTHIQGNLFGLGLGTGTLNLQGYNRLANMIVQGGTVVFSGTQPNLDYQTIQGNFFLNVAFSAPTGRTVYIIDTKLEWDGAAGFVMFKGGGTFYLQGHTKLPTNVTVEPGTTVIEDAVGGGGTGDVTKVYVDQQDAAILAEINEYIALNTPIVEDHEERISSLESNPLPTTFARDLNGLVTYSGPEVELAFEKLPQLGVLNGWFGDITLFYKTVLTRSIVLPIGTYLHGNGYPIALQGKTLTVSEASYLYDFCTDSSEGIGIINIINGPGVRGPRTVFTGGFSQNTQFRCLPGKEVQIHDREFRGSTGSYFLAGGGTFYLSGRTNMPADKIEPGTTVKRLYNTDVFNAIEVGAGLVKTFDAATDKVIISLA